MKQSHKIHQLKTLTNQQGIGLLELLISLAISLFILAGVLQLLATSTQNTASVEGLSRIQENARYAFSRLEKDIAQAGYMGCFSMAGNQERITNTLIDETEPGELNDFSQFVDGTNDSEPGTNASDKMVVRFASIANRFSVVSSSDTQFDLSGASGLETNDIAIVGDCSRAAVFRVTGASDDGQSIRHNSVNDDGDEELTNLESNIVGTADANNVIEGTSLSFVYGGDSAVEYRVDVGAAGGNCNADTPQNCVLRRGGVEIVEGVEDFQVEYGWEDGGTLFFKEANALTDNEWQLVDRVKITATFNSIQNAPTTDGTNLIRRTYARVFLIQNQLPVTA